MVLRGQGPVTLTTNNGCTGPKLKRVLIRARVPPQYAGLGEIVSVLPVIAIAMQLKWAIFRGESRV